MKSLFSLLHLFTRAQILFAALLFPGLAVAQSIFEKIYSTPLYDVAYSVENTANGGFILAGQSGTVYDTCTTDLLITKCDAEGNVEWSNTYATPACDQAFDLHQTSDGGYLVTGLSLHLESETYMLNLKLDESGGIEWQYRYQSNLSDEGIELHPLKSGGFLIGGYRYNYSYFGYDVTLTEINANGEVQWSKVYLTPGAEYGQIHVLDHGDQTYYLTCVAVETMTIPLQENFYQLRVDSAGNVISSRQYGHPETNEKGWGTIQLENNRYWLVGLSGEGYDGLLIQTDSLGEVQWAKKFNDGIYAGDESSVTSFAYQPVYGLFFCGFDAFYNPFTFLIDKGDAFIFAVNDSGEVNWWKDYGNEEANICEAFFRMQIAPDGNLLMAGGRTTHGNYEEQLKWDLYAVKTNKSGETGCEKTMTVNTGSISIQKSDVPGSKSQLNPATGRI
jgi:hypothetical protein